MIIGIDGNEANIKQRVGSNQYAFDLIHALYNLKTPHKFVIYLSQPPLGDLPKENKNWSYRVFGPGKFWTQWRLPLDLFFHKPAPDVFFSPGHYAPRWSPVPVVVSVMDLGFLKFRNQFKAKDWYQLSLWTKRSVKTASHVIAISESTKNDIIKAYRTSPEKITVTYLGYDKKQFHARLSLAEIKKVKDKYHIFGEYLLFLSTLKPSKNIEGLTEAFNEIKDQYPDLILVIAGKKGWLYEQIFERANQLGLGKRVIFTDYLPKEDVPKLMSGARVFVLPSFWEGFGIPVVEAMACDVPVIVSNVGSLPEVVGEAGVVVDPYEIKDIARGIKKALREREELIKKGRVQVKKFSWDNCARQTLEILEKEYANR